MLIQLRQNEIEEAVKMYVEAQGINLTGKKVDMNFTSGRGNNGLTVDLDIVDAKLSELTSGAQQPRALAPVSELTSGDTKAIPFLTSSTGSLGLSSKTLMCPGFTIGLRAA